MRIRDRLYYYRIELVRIIDGDTLECHMDRGHNRWDKFAQIRLANFNAPEIRGVERPEGLVATEFLMNMIGDRRLIIRTIKTDNFARFVGRLYIEDDENDIDIDVAEVMVETGHAEPFMVEINL